MTFLGLEPLTWILIAFLAVAVPLMGLADMRSLRRALERGDIDARSKAYEKTMLFQWGITLLLALVWIATGRSLGDAGLVPQFGFWPLFFSALAIAAATRFVWQVLRALGDRERLDDVRDQLGALGIVVPHTDCELARFDGLSITAGICEEFVYRGILMGLLATSLGLWPAILISSVVFGIGHAYQGPSGMVKTGLVGLVLALIVVLTGSLLVAMAVHAAIDLSQGRMLRAAVGGDRTPGSAAPDAA